MRICFLALVLLAAFPLFSGEQPVMRFDFTRTTRDGIVPNSGTGPYHAKIEGKYSVTRSGSLEMDGLTTGITVEGSEDFNVLRNATFVLLYRPLERPGNDASNCRMDGLFFKHREFVIARNSRHLYANVHDGRKWAGNFQVRDQFQSGGNAWKHIVMTFAFHLNRNDNEEWIERKFYVNGVLTGTSRIERLSCAGQGRKLEIGGCSGMGAAWRLGGEIADARVYDRILSDEEIRGLVLEQRLAKPGFRPENGIAEHDHRKIESMTASPAVKSALSNYAAVVYPDRSWEKILSAPEKFCHELVSRRAEVVLMKTEHSVHPFSFYDTLKGREMLAPDNAFVRWEVLRNGKIFRLDPLHPEVVSRLIEKPVFRSGKWCFRIAYAHRSSPDYPFDLEGQSDFVFDGGRLQFTHQARVGNSGTLLHTVDFPSFTFRALDRENDVLLLPDGCGVEHPKPVVRGFRWSQPYPRVFATMQCMAYYDPRGGVYFASEDPHGRVKRLGAAAEGGVLRGFVSWRVPYDDPARSNAFLPECRAAMELLDTGSWFEAGKIYRRVLKEIDAPFFRTLPQESRSPLLRENCYWLHEHYWGKHLDSLVKVRNYIGLDAIQVDVWKWWEPGTLEYMAPLLRAAPDWIEYMRNMKRHGVTPIPYTNGRLWAGIDRRGEDFAFSRTGRPAGVVSDNVPMKEIYRNTDCVVVCPATEAYQKYFSGLYIRLAAQGAEGIYIDQMGAAQQKPCQLAREHGHRCYDWDAWYRNGYARMLRAVRRNWSARNARHFLATEDNAEIFAGLIDAFQTYRWSSDGQVPLFPMVYSGKVEFYNRRAASPEAKIQTVAEQLLNGEQLGSFTPREIAFPFNAPFRRYAKKMIWLRHALREVFQQGEMAAPVRFSAPMRSIRRLWGIFGTNYVSKPEIQSAAWQWNAMTFVILINTGDSVHRNTVEFAAPSAEFLEMRDSSGKMERETISQPGKISRAFQLPPREFLLLAAGPRSARYKTFFRKLEDDFARIADVAKEPDPFRTARMLPEPGSDPRGFANLVRAPLIEGAARNRKQGYVDYNYLTFLYAGTFDFGPIAPCTMELEIACAMSMEGVVTAYVGEIKAENIIAEFILPKRFSSGGMDLFRVFSAPLRKKLTGKQKILFTADGFFPYRLRSWRVQDQPIQKKESEK